MLDRMRTLLEAVLPTADPPRKHRDYSHGEMIADAVAALVAGVIGFSVLFQKVLAPRHDPVTASR